MLAMKTTQSIQLLRLNEILRTLIQQPIAGDLILTTHAEAARLHLLNGQLLYPVCQHHRVRRWNRAIERFCPDWQVEPVMPLQEDQMWEYQLLHQGVLQKQLTLTQAKAVIGRVTLEVLLSLSCYIDLTNHWEPEYTDNPALILGHLSLSRRELKSLFDKVLQMQAQWQQANLGNISPNLSPILDQTVKSKRLSRWHRYLDGSYTLWDIALEMGKSVVSVTKALKPLMQKGLLQFRYLPDFTEPAQVRLPKPVPQHSGKSPIPMRRSRPLIACIDDDPMTVFTLRRILDPLGCQVVSIDDPVKGLAQVAEYKPDLIFLDLVMPNANGYIVCKFLRNSIAFQQTPVIILTSRDTVIDRNYAQLAGASEFLAKPADPKITVRMTRKYLADQFPQLWRYPQAM
jgi:chemotaxis family two-component system response regulator PixG